MNVFEWRDLEKKPFQPSELPAINVKDDNVERDYYASGRDGYLMTVSIEACATTMLEIRQVLAELEKAINQDRTWGGIARHSVLKIDEAETEHIGNKYFATRVPLEIQFVTVLGDPYTSA